MGYKRSAYHKLCRAEGMVVTRVMAELKQRRLHRKSIRGITDSARRMREHSGRHPKTSSMHTSAPCSAVAGRGAEQRSRLEESNVAPSGSAGTADGALAAVWATQSMTDRYPADDAPAVAVRNTKGTSCFPSSFVSGVIEAPSSKCPAPSSKSGTSTSHPVLLAMVVVCGADVWGGDCMQKLRGIARVEKCGDAKVRVPCMLRRLWNRIARTARVRTRVLV